MPSNKKKKKGRKKSGGGAAAAGKNGNINTATFGEMVDLMKKCSTNGDGTEEETRLQVPARASCWICLEEGPDETGQPLRRECVCRGDSGFVHLSCFVNYASRKSAEGWKKRMKNLAGCMDMKFNYSFCIPWETCPNCKQNFQGRLAFDTATAHYASTRNLRDDDYRSIVAKSSLCERTVHVDAQEGRKLAISLLQTLKKNKMSWSKEPLMSFYIPLAEAAAYETIAAGDMDRAYPGVLQQMGKKEKIISYDKSALQDALKAYDRALELYKSIGMETGIGSVKTKVIALKQTFAGEIDDDNKQDALKISRVANKICVETHSRDDYETFRQLVGLAKALFDVHRLFELHELLKESLPRANRTLGPNNDIAIWMEELLQKVKQVSALALFARNAESSGYPVVVPVVVLGYDSSNGKYITNIHPEFATPDRMMSTEPVPMSSLELSPNTAVICQNLKAATHLNGKKAVVVEYDKKRGRYQVVFEEDDTKPCLVKKENVKIFFFD